MFVFALVLILLAIPTFVFALSRYRKAQAAGGADVAPDVSTSAGGYKLGARIAGGIAIALAGVGVVILAVTSFYTQDPGQANVLRDWTGNIVGAETAHRPAREGAVGRHRHLRHPQPAGRVRRASRSPAGRQHRRRARRPADHRAGCRGRHREHRHRDPVLDRARMRSSTSTAQYYNEENLRTRLIGNDIRSVVRSVPGEFTPSRCSPTATRCRSAILEGARGALGGRRHHRRRRRACRRSVRRAGRRSLRCRAGGADQRADRAGEARGRQGLGAAEGRAGAGRGGRERDPGGVSLTAGDPAAALPRHAQGARGGRKPRRRARGLQRARQRDQIGPRARSTAAGSVPDRCILLSCPLAHATTPARPCR